MTKHQFKQAMIIFHELLLELKNAK